MTDREPETPRDDPAPDDRAPANELFPLVYAELRALAESLFRGQGAHTLQPTALVSEAYLKLAGGDGRWKDRAHFLAIAATAMRQILINHARDRRALKRGGDAAARRITLERVLAAADPGEVDLLDLDEAVSRLAAKSERQGRLAELRIFGGLTLEECARVMDVTQKRARMDWDFTKAWLKRELADD